MHPVVRTVTVSPANVTAAGRSVQLSASVSSANSCLIEASISIHGLPVAVPCPRGSVTRAITIPANTGAARVITFTVTARNGANHAVKTATVRQAVAPTAITGFGADKSKLSGEGGTVTLHATVTNATSCTWSSVPAVSGTPVTVACHAGVVTRAMSVGANTSGVERAFVFTLGVNGAAGHPSAQVSVAQNYASPLAISNETLINPHHGGPVSISCPTPSFCAVIDVHGFASTWSEGAWSTPTVVSPLIGSFESFNAISCAYADTCMAISNIGVYVFDGTSWSVAPTPQSGGYGLVAVSCASSTFCAVVDSSGQISLFDGSAWSLSDAPITLDSNSPEVSISCVSASSCVEVGGMGGDTSATAASFDGTSWHQMAAIAQESGGHMVQSVSCVATNDCTATSDGGQILHFNGSTWSQVGTYGGNDGLHSVSCSGPGSCVAVSSTGTGIIETGGVWGTPTAMDDQSAAVLATPTMEVSCTTGMCQTVDVNGYVVTLSGTTWSTPVAVDPDNTTTGVGCMSPTSCVLIDNSGKAMTFDGATWSAPTLVDAAGLNAISCGASSSCVAIGGGGSVSTFNGSTWSKPFAVSPGDVLTAVSCATPSFCVIGDESGNIFVGSGTTWSAGPAVSYRGTAISSISCPTESFCMTTDVAGGSSHFNGTSWSTATLIDPMSGAFSISMSCSSATWCLAVTQLGYDEAWSGSTWHRISGLFDSSSVVCRSATLCFAVDGFGFLTAYNGATWSSGSGAVGFFDDQTRALSCPTSSFCVTASDSGRVRTAQPR